MWPTVWLRALLLPPLLLLRQEGEHGGLQAGSLLLLQSALSARLSVALPVLRAGGGQWSEGLLQHPPVLRPHRGSRASRHFAALTLTLQEQSEAGGGGGAGGVRQSVGSAGKCGAGQQGNVSRKITTPSTKYKY